MDGWNTIVSFWEGPFSGAMLVLGRVSIYFTCSSSFSWLVYILDLSVSLLISYYTTLLSPAFLVDTAPHWCQILATWVVYVSIVPAERHLFQPRPRQSTSKNSDWCDSLPDSPLSEPGPWKKIQIPQKSNLWKSDHKFGYISTHTHTKNPMFTIMGVPSFKRSNRLGHPHEGQGAWSKNRTSRGALRRGFFVSQNGHGEFCLMTLIGKEMGFKWLMYSCVFFLQNTPINQQFFVLIYTCLNCLFFLLFFEYIWVRVARSWSPPPPPPWYGPPQY